MAPVTVARVAAVAALALVVALLAWFLVLREEVGTAPYTLVFQDAGQLVDGNEVQIGGRAVGSVTDIELTDDNQAAVEIRVEEPYAPLREGTRAVIRLTSLSGVANRYVALVPGPGDAPELRDGATLGAEATTDVVDLDQIFNTLDERTRGDLQDVIKGFAAQYEGKGDAAGESARYLNPTLSTSRQLVQEVTEDESALTRFLVNTSRAMTAIAERRGDLSSAVVNTNRTMAAVSAEDAALTRAVTLLPTTLRRANTTFVNLRATLDDLDVLVAGAKPATRELAPFLRELRPLVADARPTIRDLRTLVRRRGDDNDLVEATLKLPRLQRVATPAFRNGRGALEKAQPVLEFARPYTPELVGWFRDFGQGAANYDANGHFARIQPIFNAFSFTDNGRGGVLSPIPPANRFDGFETGVIRRCPGAATQPPPDGSAPFTDDGDLGPDDCDPSLRLPGP
jgi:phospholipid/cholesterol/gamma-HCH transport system substrate-binding protein